MIYYKKHALIFVLTAVMMYLAGSFANASFNLAEWHPFVRGVIVVVWMIIVLIQAIVVTCATKPTSPQPDRYH